MKPLLYAALFMLVGCDTQIKRNVIVPEADRDLSEYQIDGCTYIGQLRGLHSDFITHKGNCSNPIHKDTCK